MQTFLQVRCLSCHNPTNSVNRLNDLVIGIYLQSVPHAQLGTLGSSELSPARPVGSDITCDVSQILGKSSPPCLLWLFSPPSVNTHRSLQTYLSTDVTCFLSSWMSTQLLHLGIFLTWLYIRSHHLRCDPDMLQRVFLIGISGERYLVSVQLWMSSSMFHWNTWW